MKTAHGGRLPGPGARRPRGIAVRTGPAPPPLSNETHWGRKPPIGVGNLPTPMPSCLPQCGKTLAVAYPNAGRHATLPTPMHRNLPQCGRTPARCAFGAPAPAGSTANLGGGGPKRVWVSLFSVGSARGWSEMRLGFAVFGGLRAWVVRNASGFDGFGRIRVDSVRLRRFLDHMPVKPPFPPETQTLFGPPNRWGTGPLGHRAGTGGGG